MRARRPPGSRRLAPRRLLAGLVAAAAVVVLALVGTAGPAVAHAVVTSSQPADRERLPEPPKQVSITFSEGVSPDLGGISVLDARGERVDDGPTTQPKADTLQVGLRGDLPNGTYVANYRVISADGHPVTGAIAFSVGTAIDEAGASQVAERQSPVLLGLGGVGRFLAYLGALGAAGLALFALFIHDQAPDRRRVDRWVLPAAAVGAVGQLVVVANQAALASGRGLGAAVDPSVITKTVAGSLGYATLVLLAGLAAVAVSVRLRGLTAQMLAFYGFVAAAVSFALWGHSLESGNVWVSILSDVVHAAAAAVWFGGLAGLAITLVGRLRSARARLAAPEPALVGAGGSGAAAEATVATRGRPDPGAVGADGDNDVDPGDDEVDEADLVDTVGIVIRFSTMATVTVVLLGLAGGALAWLLLGSASALIDTAYGRTLLVKLVVVAGVAGLAVFNHFRLLPVVLGEVADPEEGDDAFAEPPRDLDGADDAELGRWHRLASTVRLEAIGIVVVLVVTAVLVGLTPGASSAGSRSVSSGPFNATKPVGSGKVNLVVSPALVGNNAIHITYLTNDGRPADIAQSVTVEMSLPAKGVGPLSRPATKGGPGHFLILSTSDMSIEGTWSVTLVTRLGEFEQERTTFEVPIGP